jgi:F-type H+-transporting ATPase subunit a
MGHSFTWISALPLARILPEHAVTALLITLLLIAVAAIVRRRLEDAEAALVPAERIGIGTAAEVFADAMTSLAQGVIGHGAARYVPLLGSFFIFILLCNLIGLVPGFSPPTGNFNITLALGVVSFVAYHTYGVREHGRGYVRQFVGPVIWLGPLMIVVEAFSHAFRPISLAIRLFANMFADHQVVEIFTSLTYVVVPVAFYVLGAFVAVIQAFVFTMLTAIYIALAVSHEH